MRDAKKAAIGAAAGVALSIPLTWAARQYNRPILMEVGQRVGAIIASGVGGTPGQIGYQAVDAVADRFVFYQGAPITGTSGNFV